MIARTSDHNANTERTCRGCFFDGLDHTCGFVEGNMPRDTFPWPPNNGRLIDGPGESE